MNVGMLSGRILYCMLPDACTAQSTTTNSLKTIRLQGTASDVSLRNEVQRAIAKGMAWLEKSQETNGYRSVPDHPATTALALGGYEFQLGSKSGQDEPGAGEKGCTYLMNCVQPDGGT